MREIWKNYADKYRDLGLQVVPIKPGTKVCYEKGWQEADPERFNEARFDDHGIGLLTGSVSGVVAVDIDNDDILQDVLKILPPTPCWKVGSKGATYFYKFQDQVSNPKIYLNGVPAVEILQDGQQTVLPPTLHPNGKEYSWGDPTNDLLNAVQDLPLLGPHVVEQLRNLVNKKQNLLTQKSFTGRDNHLTEMAWAAVCKNKSRELIIIELLEIDQKMHNPPFATDATEIKTRNKTPAQVMAAFVDQAIKKRGDNYQPEIIQSVEMQVIVEKEDQMPELPLFLKQLADYLGEGDNQRNGSVLTACIFMSIFLGKRVEFKHPKTGRRTAPNLYCFHIGSSGSGKGALKNRLIDLVKHCKDTLGNVCLTGLPKSDAALHRFFEKPVVCMLSEEFHQVLTAISMGNKNFAAVNETLADIYSASTGILLEKKAADAKYDAAEVVEPYLSLFAATQPFNFKNKILGTKNWGDIFHQGLAARMLFSIDDASTPIIHNESELNKNLIKDTLRSLAFATTKDQLKVVPMQLEYEKGFIEVFDAFYSEFKAEKEKEEQTSDYESIMSPIIARRLENAIKVAMIYAVCEIVEDKPLILKIEHLIRAVELCKYFERILDRVVYQDKNDDGLERVYARIKSSGSKLLSLRDICRKNHQSKEDVAAYIETLIDQNRIEAVNYKALRGPAKITYRIK